MASDFLHSTAWLKKRERILRRDGYMCQVAKRYGKRVPANIVHHIWPRANFPEYALCDWNLISVSMQGHKLLEDDCGLTDMGRALAVKTLRGRGLVVPEELQRPPGSIAILREAN